MIESVNIKKHKRTIDRKRPFVLIGNEIDGRLFCPLIYDFKNFTDLKKRLPEILVSIKGEGEWAFELYQVENDYKIWRRYGYYRYPNRGKKIFKYDYCDAPIQEVVFDESEILLFGIDMFKNIRRKRELSFEISRVVCMFN